MLWPVLTIRGYMIYVDIRSKLEQHKTLRYANVLISQKKQIIVHCTGSDNQDPRETNHCHITPGKDNPVSAKGAPKIAYADYIAKLGEDIVVYHCNDYFKWTYHAGYPTNKVSVGVVMAYRGQDSHPGDQLYSAAVSHVVRLCRYLRLTEKDVLGHRELPFMYKILGNGSKKYKKMCPGVYVDMEVFRIQVKDGLSKLSNSNVYVANYSGYEFESASVDDNFSTRGKQFDLVDKCIVRSPLPVLI